MPPDPPTPSREFLNGARNTLPILLGVVPFGLFFGALALEVGLTPIEAQGLSLFVFAGSAQFVAVDLIRQSVAPVVIVLTIFIVNLRHALYSASLAPYVARLPFRWRAVMAWLLTIPMAVLSCQQDHKASPVPRKCQWARSRSVER